MKYFFSIILMFFSCLTFANENKPSFVLVHGATGGGWDWKEVSQYLTAKGYSVNRVTLTGLGERSHLAHADIDLSTHINDVINTIHFEQLNDVVLVGHSYGGMVITGVMNAIPERLDHVTFLDAAAPAHGMSALDNWQTPIDSLNIVDGFIHFPWLKESDPIPKDVKQPLKTFTQTVSFDNPDAHKINASFVAFVPNEMSKEARTKNDSGWQRAKQRGWTLRTFSGDHVIYREKPAEIAQLLVDAIDDRNQKP